MVSRLEKLLVRSRRRKKVAMADRQPLVRPLRSNEVWSADFVFDRLADGRSLKAKTGKWELSPGKPQKTEQQAKIERLRRELPSSRIN